MIKDFNILLSLNDITNCYKNNTFPNAHCLIWNQETSAELLMTQSNDIIKTQNDNTGTLNNIITTEFNLIGIESEE